MTGIILTVLRASGIRRLTYIEHDGVVTLRDFVTGKTLLDGLEPEERAAAQEGLRRAKEVDAQ